ncbi:MAG: hypothetical protein WCE64_16810 [Bacteroidales bacterium]
MKRIALITSFLLYSFVSTYGQWYVKKYNVTGIDQLSSAQLDESWLDARKSAGYSISVACIGGILYGVARLFPEGEIEDPNFWEQMMGVEVVNKTAMGAGIGIAACGVIAGIVYSGRAKHIRSAIERNYPPRRSFQISPGAVSNKFTGSITAGISVTWNF